MRASNSRDYVTTFALAILALVLTLPAHGGFMLLVCSPFIAGSLIYNSFLLLRKPERRRLSVVRLIVWLVIPTLVGGVHWHLYRASRADADAALAAVLGYHSQTGSWPQKLRDAGVDETGLRSRWMLGYLLKDGSPIMFYAATYTMFDVYSYDFDARRWDYKPD